MIDANIKKLFRAEQDAVIELDDGVEYLLDTSAIDALDSENTKIDLMRLYDHQRFLIDRKVIIDALVSRGVVDYLDRK